MSVPMEAGAALPADGGAVHVLGAKDAAVIRAAAGWQRAASDASTDTGLSDPSEPSEGEECPATTARASCRAGSGGASPDQALEDDAAAMFVFAMLLALAAALSWCCLPTAVAMAVLGLALVVVAPSSLLPRGSLRVA